MAGGRSTESRTASVTTTSGSAAITASAGTFSQEDVGRTITGTGIPAGATVSAVTSGTAATLSANATASGTVTATLGNAVPANAGYAGWSPETATEAADYTEAAEDAGTAAPDRPGNSYTETDTRRARG